MAEAAPDRGRLRASGADREQMIETLKVAFVQGRLTRDELDMRVGHALASRTHADLALVIADIPAGLAAAQHSQTPARARKSLAERIKVVMWSACVIIPLAGLLATIGTGNSAWFILSVLGCIGAAVPAVSATLEVSAQKGSRRQLSQGPPPGAGGFGRSVQAPARPA